MRTRGCFLALGLLLTSSVFAAGEPKNSKVEIESKTVDKSLQFALKLKPNEGLVVTLDAPWKLDIKTSDGLTFAKTTLSKADMDDKLPGFVVTGVPAKPQGEFEYSLISFVCKADKTTCYREVHTGKHSWTSAQK